MSHRQFNLQHIHRYSPVVKAAGKGLILPTSSHQHQLHHRLKHLQLGKGSVAHHHDEELEGAIIHPRNERHHKAPQHNKKHHTKSIAPLKFRF